jgi:subtilisin family serine protease
MSSRSRRRLSAALAPVAAIALVLTLPQAAGANPALATATPDLPVESATGLWIVTLDEPALASYAGGVAGLAATSPHVTGERRLDVTAPASLAYLDHLADRQQQFADHAERSLGRTVEVAFEYRNAINGVAIRVTAAEAARLAELPGVSGVYPDELRTIETDTSHNLIRSAAIWDGQTTSGVATRGEGVVVGMLDTGVNPNHPSFAEIDGTGYVHQNPFGSGNFVGVCHPSHPQHEPICNDKLIGAWNFHPSSPSAQDWNDHGSHVGSTIAGNIHDATFTVGGDTYTRTIQGVAPRANVISYLVCFPSCPSTSSVAAVNQAISDGVDVLNYSISGTDNPWNDIVDLAFLNAFNAGMFVSASAGNAGPGASTVAKTGPWNASVAASTNYRVFGHTVDVTGPAPVPGSLTSMAAPPGAGPQVTSDITARIRYAGLVSPGNSLGCSPFPGGGFNSSIALIERGQCPFATKVNNAATAGAVAVVIFNNWAGPPVAPGGLEGTSIPAVMIDMAGGTGLRDFIVGHAPTASSARINAATDEFAQRSWSNVMAGFSSRGPSQFDMLAPTVTAPGVNILAAGREIGGNPNQYAFLQGTSMSSPHVAGAGALLVALHPGWSAAEVRSALASTARSNFLVKEDGVTRADPFDQGSGLIDLRSAARIGLVMDETHANFVAANPAIGGDPRTLNLPAMVDANCVSTCTWSRTVTGTIGGVAALYQAQVTAPAGMNVTVSPSQFVVSGAGTQQLTITVDASGLPPGTWAFAEVTLAPVIQTGTTPISPVRYPVAVRP